MENVISSRLWLLNESSCNISRSNDKFVNLSSITARITHAKLTF